MVDFITCFAYSCLVYVIVIVVYVYVIVVGLSLCNVLRCRGR